MPDAPTQTETAGRAARARLPIRGESSPRPAPRDWSNLVFAARFCEEARRAFDNWSAEAQIGETVSTFMR